MFIVKNCLKKLKKMNDFINAMKRFDFQKKKTVTMKIKKPLILSKDNRNY